MDPHLPLFEGQRDQCAVVFAFPAKFPCAGVTLDKAEKRFALGRLHRQHFHLRRGLLFEFAKPTLQPPLCSGINDAGAVHDIGARVRYKYLAPTQRRAGTAEKRRPTRFSRPWSLPAISHGFQAVDFIIEPREIIPVMLAVFLQRRSNAGKGAIGFLLDPADDFNRRQIVVLSMKPQ